MSLSLKNPAGTFHFGSTTGVKWSKQAIAHEDGPEAANTTMEDLEAWENKLSKIFQLEAMAGDFE